MADFPELDGEEEPLFADDLMDDEDDPPPLPPPMPSLSQLSQRRGPPAGGNSPGAIDSDPFTGAAAAFLPDTGETGGEGDGNANKQEPPQKKRKPLLTLKIDRIFAEKGLPYIEKEFPKLKFKGKGHEVSDLKYLMQQYEHWANAMYPKMTFKDVTDRIESLAKKKEFKSKLVQMRRRFARGGVTTPPISDDDDDEGHLPGSHPPPNSGGTTTTVNNRDNDIANANDDITNTSDIDTNNYDIGDMVTNRASEDGDGTQTSQTGRSSTTALTRLTMDGYDSSGDE